MSKNQRELKFLTVRKIENGYSVERYVGSAKGSNYYHDNETTFTKTFKQALELCKEIEDAVNEHNAKDAQIQAV
jgi:hypothetical protein